MSELSDAFNKIWPDLPYGKARSFRVFMEVRRIITKQPIRQLTVEGKTVSFNRQKDLTLWELRLAEIIVDKLKENTDEGNT